MIWNVNMCKSCPPVRPLVRPPSARRPPAAVWIFWKPGNPEFWDREIQKFGIQKMEKIKILKIEIRSAQNVGKAWISRKKILPAPLGAIPGHFLHGPKKSKKCQDFPYFCLVVKVAGARGRLDLAACQRFV